MKLDLVLSSLIILLSVIPPLLPERHNVAPTYKLLFGGVLGQELANMTRNDEDIAAIIQIALEQIHGKKVEYHQVKAVRKQRLLFSRNGTHPHMFRQHSMSRNGQLVVQNIQLVLGLLYHVSISHQGGDHLCKECRLLEHDLILTRDRNKEFHVFQHTTRHSDLTVAGSSTSHWDGIVFENCTCSLMSLKTGVNRGISSDQQENLLWTYESQHHYTDHLNFQSPLHVIQKHENGHCAAKPGQNGGCQVQTSRHLHSLRVATYNIWNINRLSDVNESYEDRINRLGKFVSSLDVGIIGFQEVRLEVFHHNPTSSSPRKKASTTQPQVSQLTQYLAGYQYVYQPAMLYTDRLPERSEEGVAIFSQYPIVSSDYILLFRNTSDEVDSHQRVCLHAEILTPYFSKVHVFVTHLSLSKDSQERSVIEIWKYMERFSGVKFLMGDLNTEPHSPTIRFLAGETSLQGITTYYGLSDAWTAVHSNRNKTGFTFSALDNRPVKRIDYIFMSQSNSPVAQVVETDVMNSDKFCNIPCSDHLPLVTQILPIINETQ